MSFEERVKALLAANLPGMDMATAVRMVTEGKDEALLNEQATAVQDAEAQQLSKPMLVGGPLSDAPAQPQVTPGILGPDGQVQPEQEQQTNPLCGEGTVWNGTQCVLAVNLQEIKRCLVVLVE